MYSKFIANNMEPSQYGLFSGIYPSNNGYLKATPDFRVVSETSNDFYLYYVSSGDGILKCKNKEYIIEKNDTFFLFPGISYSLNTNPDNLLELWRLGFNGPNANSLMDFLQIRPDSSVIKGMNNMNFIKEMENLVLSYRLSTPSDILYATGTLYKLFGIILDEYSSSGWDTVKYSDSSITYHGTWTMWPSPIEISGGEHYTNTPKSFVEFKFIGSGIKWIGVKNSDCGIATVCIDGIYQSNVDTYSPCRLSRQLLYVNTGLSSGEHTITVSCTGEKNSSSSGFDIVIDVFKFLASPFNLYGEAPKVGASKLIKGAVDYMNLNYAREIIIEHLSESAGMSRAYFTTRFKSELGLSPSEYLTSVRLKRAKHYLTNTRLLIKEISISVGFHDVFYFSRLFKKLEKVSPSEFRLLHCKN